MSLNNVAIKVPGTIRGDRALREFSEDVRNAIRELAANRPDSATRPVFAPPYCPLTPYYLRKEEVEGEEEGQWKVQFRPGYVYELTPGAAEANVKQHQIFVGTDPAVALDAAEPPDIDIDLGNYIYLHFETESDGELKEIVEGEGIYADIRVEESEKASTYHILPDGDGANGEDGDYYVLLAQVETVDENALMSRNGWRGNFLWHAGWNACANEGSGVGVYHGYNIVTDRKYFRSITERVTNHQINVGVFGDDDEEIRIEGNAMDGGLRLEDCGGTELYTLNWSDGLITGYGSTTIKVPSCYHPKAQLYFAATEANDSYTFSTTQKDAISTFFDTLESACLLDKVKHVGFTGTNAAVALRNAVCPGLVQCTWNVAPTTFSGGAMDLDGVDGEMNQTPYELGLATKSQGVFMTITGAPRNSGSYAPHYLSSYSTSTKNTQLKQDTGEISARLSFSSNIKGRNETQNGLFLSTRLDNNCTTVFQTSYGGVVNQSTITDTRTQNAGLASPDITYILGSGSYNCEGQLSTIGITTGMNQAQAEYFATALFTVAVDTGHTALEST